MPSLADPVTVAQPASACAVASLPFELLLHVFRPLSGPDVVHFLSTNRAYRAIAKADSIWRALCARFGVHDLPSAGFHHHASFYTVYTGLLHPYGPLLGLWANDTVFQGNVMQFRLVTESAHVRWEGIVAEVWKFHMSQAVIRNVDRAEEEIRARMRNPTDPVYYECLRIELLPPAGAPAAEPSPGRTRFSWTLHDNIRHPLYDAEPRHVPSPVVPIRLRAPHRQGCYVYQGTPRLQPIQSSGSLHPVFPVTTWLDTARPLPRLQLVHEETKDHRAIFQNQRDEHPVRLLYLAPAPAHVPLVDAPSILVLPTPGRENVTQHRDMHVPNFRGNIMDMRRILLEHEIHNESDVHFRVTPLEARYYPLREPTPPPPLPSSGLALWDPTSELWDPRTLEGVWLGAYSAHGTEVLWITYDAPAREVQAWKITGDSNVPRGALSWKFYSLPHSTAATEQLLKEMDVEDADLKAPLRVYDGEGVVSEIGFTEEGRGTCPLIAAVVNPNEIRCSWRMHVDITYVPRYKRYLGRDIPSETVLVSGIRRAANAFV